MRRRTVGYKLVLVVASAAAVGGCGSEAAPITFDSVPAEPDPTTTTVSTASEAPATTTTSVGPTLPGDTIGPSWEDATGDLAGLPSECGNLSYVSARPDRPGLVTGVALQGMWSSDDSGETWLPLGEGEESDEVTFRLTDVEYDPDDPNRFWATGLYNGGGMYHTDDGGATLRQLGSLWSVEDVGIDFSDPQRATLVAAGHDVIQVYLSRDGGETWEAISAGLPDEGGTIDSVEVVDSNSFLVALRGGQVPGIFRTDDAGATWERVYTQGVAGEPVWLGDELIWLIERGRGLVVSSDNGQTWTDVPSSSISPFSTSLTLLPDGRLVTVSDRTLVVSDDRGITWRPLGPGLPYEPTGVAYAPHEAAFFIWRQDCEFGEENPIRSSTIMRLAFEPAPR